MVHELHGCMHSCLNYTGKSDRHTGESFKMTNISLLRDLGNRDKVGESPCSFPFLPYYFVEEVTHI